MSDSTNKDKPSSNWKHYLFQLGYDALIAKEGDIKKQIDELHQKKGEGQHLDTANTLELQYLVGEHSNLMNIISNIEKSMKDSIAVAARNSA